KRLSGKCEPDDKPATPKFEVEIFEKCEVDSYLKIYEAEGVDYFFDDGEGVEPIEPGIYDGPLEGTLTAVAQEGYELTAPLKVEVNIPAAKPCPWALKVIKTVEDPDEVVEPEATFEINILCVDDEDNVVVDVSD